MNWYYARNQEKVGPIEEAEFDRLVHLGEITPATLVWREGMVNWQTQGDLNSPLRASITPGADAGSVRCTECGGFFPQDQVIRLGIGHVCATCKPIAMQKLSEGVMASSAEQIRTEHIKHEASVKSIGGLYFLGGTIILLTGAIAALYTRVLMGVMSGLLFVLIGGSLIVTAVGLHKLKRWARIPTGILSGIGLLGFPLGTIINGYILYLVFCRKGAMVFSDEYKIIIAETPDVKYRTSLIVWIVLIVFVLLLGAVFVGVLGRSR